MNHDKSHPSDQGRPLVSLGQGDYRKDIMPGDVSKGHTRAEEGRALDRLAADIVACVPGATVEFPNRTPPARTHDGARDGHAADGYVPLSRARPTPTESFRREHLRALAASEQSERELQDHAVDLLMIATAMDAAEERGENYTLSGEELSRVRRVLGLFLLRTVDGMCEGGVS